MVRLTPAKSLHHSNSLRRAGWLGACVLGALLSGCATGARIDDDVLLIAGTPRATNADDPLAAGGSEGPEDAVGAAPDGAETAADTELPPASSETNEGGPEEGIPRGDQPGDETSSSDDENPSGDSQQNSPAEEPIEPAPDVDTTPVAEPGPSPDPSPDDGPPSNPPDPPDTTEPEPAPPDPDPVEGPPAEPPVVSHCLADWEGSSCDVCSNQTQSDLLACRLYIECYIASDCDPLSCGSLDGACSANRLGNGLAPKAVADSVYACVCDP